MIRFSSNLTWLIGVAALVGVLAWLLAGCKSARVPQPPLPPGARAASKLGAMTGSASRVEALSVTPVGQLTLRWKACHRKSESDVYEVWHTCDLRTNWTLAATVTGETYMITPTAAREFFRVRVRAADGQLSGWATTAEVCP